MGSATMFGNVAETRSDAKSIGFLIPMTYPSAVAAKKEMERTPKADTIMNQYDPIDEAVTDCAIVLYISERTSTWKPNLATTPTDLDGKRGFRRGTDETTGETSAAPRTQSNKQASLTVHGTSTDSTYHIDFGNALS